MGGGEKEDPVLGAPGQHSRTDISRPSSTAKRVSLAKLASRVSPELQGAEIRSLSNRARYIQSVGINAAHQTFNATCSVLYGVNGQCKFNGSGKFSLQFDHIRLGALLPFNAVRRTSWGLF